MVGLYLDDVRLTYNAPDPDLRLVDIARVEVVRGPQGALYGSGSMGGVVQIVTAQPDPNGYSGSLSAEADGTEGLGDSWAVDAVVNLPLFANRGAGRIVVYDETRSGYINDVGLHLSDVNRSYRTGARAAFKIDLSDRWTIDFGGLEQEIKADDTQYAVRGLPPYARSNALREPYDNDFGELHLGLRGDLTFGDLNASLAYIGHGLTSRFDATAAPPVPSPPGPSAFETRDDIRSLVAEATLTSKADAPAQWLGGIFIAGTRQGERSTLTALDASALPVLDDTRGDRLTEAALFGDVAVRVAPSLELTLGGRLFTSQNSIASFGREPIANAFARFSGAQSRSGFAPKLVLAYRPNPSFLIYAEAAEGYRSGGFNAGAPDQTFIASASPPSRSYRGDELWNVEIGTRIAAPDGRLWVRAAAFEDFWKNVQSDQLLASGLPFTANLGDGTDRGLEFEAGFRLGALQAHAQFLVDEPELARRNAIFPGTDFALSGVPGESAGVDMRYAWPLPRDRSLEADVRAQYVGRSHLTLDPGTARSMGGYADGRLALSLVDPRFRMTIAADNPFASRGNTFAFGNPFTARLEDQITPLRPRTVSLQVSVPFP